MSVEESREGEALDAAAHRPRYAPISSKLFGKLEQVPPSHDGAIAYRPCLLRMHDGTVHQHVYVMAAGDYIRKWGIPTDPALLKRMVRIEEVVDLEESPHRLPPAFANELYAEGESGMGYYAFRVRFRNGAARSYVTGNTLDFIPFPPGLTPDDVVKVEPHGGRGDTATSGFAHRWCLFDGIQTAL